MRKNNKIAILGAGASGLFTSILLASKGFDVTLYEKNNNHLFHDDVFNQMDKVYRGLNFGEDLLNVNKYFN